MKIFTMVDLFKKRFQYYKNIADKAVAQISDEQISWQYNEESNSVAVLMKHLSGNMISRWTNFLTEDGEKDWRDRDAEFENTFTTKKEITEYWEKGWSCLFNALHEINDDTIQKSIHIKNEPLSVLDALIRQLAHCTYHIGQMVYIAKMLKNSDWQNLSIPKKRSPENPKENKSDSAEDRESSSPVCYAQSKEVRDEYKNP